MTVVCTILGLVVTGLIAFIARQSREVTELKESRDFWRNSANDDRMLLSRTTQDNIHLSRANKLLSRLLEEDKLADDTSFSMLRLVNEARCRKHYHAVHAWSPSDWMTAVCGEVGELAGIVKNIRRAEEEDIVNGHTIKKYPTMDEQRDAIGDEAADIVIYLDLLCARCGVNLGHAVKTKFNAVSTNRLNTEEFIL